MARAVICFLVVSFLVASIECAPSAEKELELLIERAILKELQEENEAGKSSNDPHEFHLEESEEQKLKQLVKRAVLTELDKELYGSSRDSHDTN